MSSLPASIKRIGSKTTEKMWRHHFPHYKSMGAFCCHGNQSFDPICPKTLCSLSPTPVMLHIKFDQDWPTGFRDIQVWKCGHDDGRQRTDDGPLVYYKLTLWAFGSGKLINHGATIIHNCSYFLPCKHLHQSKHDCYYSHRKLPENKTGAHHFKNNGKVYPQNFKGWQNTWQFSPPKGQVSKND